MLRKHPGNEQVGIPREGCDFIWRERAGVESDFVQQAVERHRFLAGPDMHGIGSGDGAGQRIVGKVERPQLAIHEQLYTRGFARAIIGCENMLPAVSGQGLLADDLDGIFGELVDEMYFNFTAGDQQVETAIGLVFIHFAEDSAALSLQFNPGAETECVGVFET